MRLIVVLGMAASAGTLFAQSRDQGPAISDLMGRSTHPAAETDHRPNIRVDRILVPVPVSVTDPLGRFVTGLEKQDFRVFEDKVEQKISQVSSEDAPLSVGIVFDTSGSMGAKLGTSRQAVAQFLKTANPEDEFCLVEFNDTVNMTVRFTAFPEEIQSRLAFTRAHGSTALLDAIYVAINQIRKARNPRKAILVISDGGDNASRYTAREIKNAVRESDVQLYAIGIYEVPQSRGRTPEEADGPELLNELAQQTGGRSFVVANLAELPDVAARIGIELRNQYVLYYSPTNVVHDGKYRRVQVKLVKKTGLPPLTSIFRKGYYAPAR